MIEITPQTPSSLYYEIPQLYDGGTYYVRAVVKNLITQETYGTYDLIQIGDKIWHKDWTTPPDNFGTGSFFIVNYTVYDDASYTTVSANYGQKAEYIRVIQPWTLGLSGSGGGFYNPEMDLRRIEKVLEEFKKDFREEFDKKLYKAESDKKEIMGLLSGLNKVLDSITTFSDKVKKASDEANGRHKFALDSIQTSIVGMEDRAKELRKEMADFVKEENKKLRDELQNGSVMRDNQVGAFYKMLEMKLIPKLESILGTKNKEKKETKEKPEPKNIETNISGIRSDLGSRKTLRDLLTNENSS